MDFLQQLNSYAPSAEELTTILKLLIKQRNAAVLEQLLAVEDDMSHAQLKEYYAEELAIRNQELLEAIK